MIRAARRIFCLFLMSLIASQSGRADEAYFIGPQDTLALSVYEWRSDTREPYEWEALSGEFTVEASGRLSLPLIGTVAVAGRTAEEVSDLIAARLQKAVGLVSRPTASVQVKTFRSIYVVGSVDQPGEYEFRPGLTVLQAIGLAGGLPRSADWLFARFERDAISARGDLQVIKSSLDALMAKRARLLAELGKAESISFSSILTERRRDPDIARIMEQERLIFDARRRSVEAKVEAGQRLQKLLIEQIDSMKAQIKLRETQIASAREELEKVSGLVDRGLGTAGRQLDLERTVADYESSRLDLERSIIAAQVAIANTERSTIDLHSRLREDAALELRQTDDNIHELSKKFETASQLLQEAEVTGPLNYTQAQKAQEITGPDLSILREVDGQIKETVASENTLVKPGDTVRVALSLPEIPSIRLLAPTETFDQSFDLEAQPLPSLALDDAAPPESGEGLSMGDGSLGQARSARITEPVPRRDPPQRREDDLDPADSAHTRPSATGESPSGRARASVEEVPVTTSAPDRSGHESGRQAAVLPSPSVEEPRPSVATSVAGATNAEREGSANEEVARSQVGSTGEPQAERAMPESEEAQTLVVTASSLNIRAKPQLTSGVIGVYERGVVVKVLEVGEGWFRVEAPDGTSGWMSADHLAPANTSRSDSTAGATF
jgi:polysaccharide export outer membrane protein/exopolysaccharide production protein ExoF